MIDAAPTDHKADSMSLLQSWIGLLYEVAGASFGLVSGIGSIISTQVPIFVSTPDLLREVPDHTVSTPRALCRVQAARGIIMRSQQNPSRLQRHPRRNQKATGTQQSHLAFTGWRAIP